MKTGNPVQLGDVRAVYEGPEFELWELLMGWQIHIGGLPSSQQLAEKAGIRPGTSGVDLCCCTGAGMWFLVQLREVARMHGVDATESVVELGRSRCESAGLSDRIAFTARDACQTELPAEEADFVWGEDAWCYVVDKPGLVAEASRLVKPGGTIAFTDWVEGPAGMSEQEGQRLLRFMKFPNVQALDGYGKLLSDNGCEVTVCEDTGQFPPHVDLYLTMLRSQLRFDALRIIGFDVQMLDTIIGEMEFMRELATARKLVQGRFVARKMEA